MVLVLRKTDQKGRTVGVRIDFVGLLAVDQHQPPLRLVPSDLPEGAEGLHHRLPLEDLLGDELHHDFGVGLAGELHPFQVVAFDLSVVCDDSVVDCVKSAGLIKVGVGVPADPSPARGPASVGNAGSRGPGLLEDLLNDSIDAGHLRAVALIGVFDKAAVHAFSQAENSS